MLDFWGTLTTLILHYTIADTAYVFAIIEGFAAVVAAVAAIIAVVVTKRIAKKQIDIAEKQNEISDKQADIAIQQNKIALFENRSIAYDALVYFFGIWNSFRVEILESLKGLSTVNSFQAYISLRELGKLDLDFIQNKDWFYFQSKQSDFFLRDINSITQILRLFRMPEEQKVYLSSILAKYKKLSDAIHSMKYPDYSVMDFEKLAIELNSAVSTQPCKDLLVVLNKQISFSDN